MKAAPTPSPALAVVGLASVFPDAPTAEALWESLLAGRRAFRKLPPEKMPRDLYWDPDPEAPDKTYSDLMAVITGWEMDAAAFRVPPATVAVTDTTHWLALATARAALDDSGLRLDAVDRTRAGVVLGNSLGGEFGRTTILRYRWPYVERALRRAATAAGQDGAQTARLLEELRHQYLAPLPPVTEDSLAGTMSNTIAGRICGHFDLGGCGYTVDGACSSSLLSVAHACDLLSAGSLDVALAGGVDVSLDPFETIGFSKTRVLARQDIRPYDARAEGMLPGEGCGVVVLMREEDARAAGLRVRALVRGWGVASDGRGGITEPGRDGQVRALRAAYRRAGYPLSSVGLVEGHGTATVKGDRVEIAALQEVLAEEPPGGPILLGSVKGNVGHCKAAAGMAGLVKAVMALERKILPPTAGCRDPHPLLAASGGPLQPAVEGRPWAAAAGPRRAGVSAFGFGGSNAHVTLEEANPEGGADPREVALLGSAQAAELVVVSAPDGPSLAARLQRVAAVAERACRAELTDLAATLATEEPRAWRVAVVAETPWELAEKAFRLAGRLEDGLPPEGAAEGDPGVHAGIAGEGRPVLAALFPGQGSQYPRMVRHLARRHPEVRQALARFDAAAADLLPAGVGRWLEGDGPPREPGYERALEAQVEATEVAQPAVVAASLAVLQVLRRFGLVPEWVLGHSLGEISALAAAGVLEPEAAVRLAAVRGRAMGGGGGEGDGSPRSASGGMAAVAAPADRVREMLQGYGDRLTVANHNSPHQTVVSGDAVAAADLVRACRDRGVRARLLPVSNAFHSPAMAGAAEPVRQAAAGLDAAPPRVRVVSTVTGGPLPPDADLADLLATQLTAPVRFLEAVETLAEAARPTLWLEVGPGGVLSSLYRQIVGDAGAPAVTTLERDAGFTPLLHALGRAFALGFPVRTERLFEHRLHRPLSLDGPAPRLLANPAERTPPPRSAGDAGTEAARERPAPVGSEEDAALAYVVGWLGERCGYDPSVVSAETRLRDDLNLDSIKSTELMQCLLERHEGARWPAPGWDRLPLRSLVQQVVAGRDGEGADAPSRSDGVEGLATLPGADWVDTFAVAPAPAPLEAEEDLGLPSPGSVFVVGEAGCPRASALAHRLIDLGLAPESMTSDLLLQNYPPEALGGLVLTLPAAPGGEGGGWLDEPARDQACRLEREVELLYRLGRWLVGAPAARAARLRLLVVRPGGPYPGTGPSPDDAGRAFLRSLALEYPNLSTRWLRVPTSWEPRRVADAAALELTRGGERGWYGLEEDGRRVALVASPSPRRRAPFRPSPEDGILVTGGARGITCELALALARRARSEAAGEGGIRFALLGRSAPDHPEVARNLERFAESGARPRYLRCDVTDGDAVAAAVRRFEAESGPVTGILHGAGATRPTAFADSTLADHLSVVRVKTVGLRNVVEAVDPGRLRMLHAVSSVLGHTGMAGQADYTFANAWLDGVVGELESARPDLHVASLGYTVWRDTGLGEGLGLVDRLRAAGVTPVEPAVGVAAYEAVLDGRPAASRVVVTGRLTPSLEAALYPPPPRRRPPFLERVVRRVPGRELVAEARVDHAGHPYLAHHVFRGTPLLPAVLGIDAMVAAARDCLGVDGTGLPVLEDLRLESATVVPEGEAVTVRVYAVVESAADGFRVCTALRSSADGFASERMGATCVFGGPAVAAGAALESPLPRPLPLQPDHFAPRPLFQGTFFRRISAIRRLDPGREALVDVLLPDDGGYFQPEPEGDGSLATPYPAARDAFFQSLMLLLPERPFLPTGVRRIVFLRVPPAGTTVTCRARLVEDHGSRLVLDLAVFTADGEPVEQLEGVTVEAVGHTGRPNIETEAREADRPPSPAHASPAAPLPSP